MRQDLSAKLLSNGHYIPGDPYTVISTVFLDCRDNADGGAVYINADKSPTIDDCAFSGCYSSGRGGGIFASVKSITIKNSCAYICTAANTAQFSYEKTTYSLITTVRSYMQYCSLVNCGNDFTTSQATIFETGVFQNSNINYSLNYNNINGNNGIISTKNSHQIGYDRLNFFNNTGKSIIDIDAYFAVDISNAISNFNIINCTYNTALITFKGNVDCKNFYAFYNVRQSSSTSDVFAAKDGIFDGSVSYSQVNTDMNFNFGLFVSVNRDFGTVNIPISIRECPATPSYLFTVSSDFTISNVFTNSRFFSSSSKFSPSNSFTPSVKFTLSQSFSPSESFIPSDNFTQSCGDTPSPTGTFTASNLLPVNKEMIRAQVSNVFGNYSTEGVVAVSASVSVVLIIVAVLLMIIYLRHKAKQRKLRNNSGEFSMSDTEMESTSYSYYYTYEYSYSSSSYNSNSNASPLTKELEIIDLDAIDYKDPYILSGHTL